MQNHIHTVLLFSIMSLHVSTSGGLAGMAIVNFKFLRHCSEAKRRALAYLEGLHLLSEGLSSDTRPQVQLLERD